MTGPQKYSTKWIIGLKPEMSGTRATVLSLSQRFHSVFHYFPLAAKHADRDVEFVHQLRVSTRRAAVVLHFYRQLLPKKRARRIGRYLRDIRQAAGDARDYDVLLIRFAREQRAGGGLKKLITKLQKKRRKAQSVMARCYSKFNKTNARKKCERLVQQAGWRGEGIEPNFRQVAERGLSRAVSRVGDCVATDSGDIVALHRMRIALKQLRYTLELVKPVFSRATRQQLYPAVTELQDSLGQITDLASSINLLGEFAQEGKSQGRLKELMLQDQQRLTSAVQNFRREWTVSRVEELLDFIRQQMVLQVE
ncbi:MAG: CHAD domain-containing protein [Rhodopirellula sp.]|nr:CHAD domain-containing protein [Rhodopirellula sp.]